MIIVTVDKNGGGIKGFMVSGHARFGPAGQDIVCAAVSMLAQTTVLGLGRFIKKDFTFDLDEAGTIKCSLPDHLSGIEQIQAQAILETLLLGVKNLQQSYPKHLRVFRRRWTSC